MALTQVLWSVGAVQCVLITRHRPTALALQLLHGERTIYSSPVESRAAAIAIADDLRQRVAQWDELPQSSDTGK